MGSSAPRWSRTPSPSYASGERHARTGSQQEKQDWACHLMRVMHGLRRFQDLGPFGLRRILEEEKVHAVAALYRSRVVAPTSSPPPHMRAPPPPRGHLAPAICASLSLGAAASLLGWLRAGRASPRLASRQRLRAGGRSRSPCSRKNRAHAACGQSSAVSGIKALIARPDCSTVGRVIR